MEEETKQPTEEVVETGTTTDPEKEVVETQTTTEEKPKRKRRTKAEMEADKADGVEPDEKKTTTMLNNVKHNGTFYKKGSEVMLDEATKEHFRSLSAIA